MTRNIIVGTVIAVAIVAIAVVLYNIPTQSHRPSANLQERLTACGSLPNGTTENATETSRMFINIPRDIYPNINLEVTSRGAVANDISNGGQYGYALGVQGKPDCWSYYFEFDLASSSQHSGGTVDIGSKSGLAGIPDYLIHITVPGVSSPTPASTSKGTVNGQALLGPTCPVERIPPDPNCAPRPYQTSILAFKISDTSTPYMTTTSDASGTFALSLNPGAYVLRASGGSAYPRCSDTTIQVNAGETQNVVINCDTGIR